MSNDGIKGFLDGIEKINSPPLCTHKHLFMRTAQGPLTLCGQWIANEGDGRFLVFDPRGVDHVPCPACNTEAARYREQIAEQDRRDAQERQINDGIRPSSTVLAYVSDLVALGCEATIHDGCVFARRPGFGSRHAATWIEIDSAAFDMLAAVKAKLGL